MSTQAETPAAEPPRVRPLPDALIDQIAAGEVVERPASVVKELVENSLDAGATRVRVELRDGGREFIAVTDDGCGMTPQDARLALQRHATSKIRTADDLTRIETYGFRGEALPAIASVSALCLRTRTAGADAAIELRLEQGRLVREGPAGAPPGTRIEVADLFAGVPARRKFLKAATTEWGHIADWLARAALALPHVHVEIRRDDRPAQTWPAARDLLERAAAVLGEPEAAALVPVHWDEGRASVAGLVSRPDRHRPTLSGVHLFVNRRPVRDRLMQHALVEAYRDVLPRGRFPSAVLFVTVPAQAVDVNVHPAKWEVRFADPQAIHRLVRGAARQALSERRWLSGAPATAGGSVPARAPGASDWVLAVREPGPGRPRGAGLEPEPAALPGLVSAPAGRLRFGDLPLIGQLLATYLVLETREGLLLVDQHAAHERVLYERLREQWRGGAVESQGLIAPEPVALDPVRCAALAEAAPELARLGFDLEPFGGDAVAVRAVPALLAERDPAGLVRDLADRLAAGSTAGAGQAAVAPMLDAADRVFASLACHAARRKGDLLDMREQRALLDAVDAIPWAPTCPHGRPVAVPFELAEIERRFARR